MNCHEAKKRWHLQLETDRHDAALKEHLNSCVPCKEYDKEMAVVLDQLGSLHDSTEHIHGIYKTGQSQRQVIKPRSWIGLAIRVAAVIGIVAFAGFYYSIDSGPVKPLAKSAKPVNVKPTYTAAKPYPNLGLSLRGNSAKKYMAVAQASSDATVHMYTLYKTFN